MNINMVTSFIATVNKMLEHSCIYVDVFLFLLGKCLNCSITELEHI